MYKMLFLGLKKVWMVKITPRQIPTTPITPPPLPRCKILDSPNPLGYLENSE